MNYLKWYRVFVFLFIYDKIRFEGDCVVVGFVCFLLILKYFDVEIV